MKGIQTWKQQLAKKIAIGASLSICGKMLKSHSDNLNKLSKLAVRLDEILYSQMYPFTLRN